MSNGAAFSQKAFTQSLKKYYSVYTGGFIAFVIVLAIAEQLGMPNRWIGYAFLFSTILLYAVIGVMSRTADIAEYYVAGRRVPALFNGMATGADWMSAASFIGMAGGLYIQGYDGLAFIMGWTGGYCLVALFLAPYLRKFGQFTIPGLPRRALRRPHPAHDRPVLRDPVLVHLRRGADLRRRPDHDPVHRGRLPGRRVPRAGRHPGVLVPGRDARGDLDAGGAIHHPDHRLHDPADHAGVPPHRRPVPHVVYGYQLQKVTAREQELTKDPKEIEVRDIFKKRAAEAEAPIKGLPAFLPGGEGEGREAARRPARPTRPRTRSAPRGRGEELPGEPEAARALDGRAQCRRARNSPPLPHATEFAAPNEKAQDIKRKNFLALIFCLMVGTAALPHILMRYYTTPSVREARVSVTWSLFFIFLLYFTAPAVAVLVKYEMYHSVVGRSFADLPAWVKILVRGGSHAAEHRRHQR